MNQNRRLLYLALAAFVCSLIALVLCGCTLL